MTYTKVLQTDHSKTNIIIRLMVGLVFLSEGMQKFIYPAIRGVGRFEKMGFPAPKFFASFMRLKPVEKPKGVLLKLAYWITKTQYGKVIGLMKVIYARKTPLLFFTKKIFDIDSKIKLPAADKLLIRNFVSHLNNCSFCSYLAAYEAARHDLEQQKVLELLNYRNAAAYSEREKALLAYVEEVTTTKHVSNQTFQNLKQYYSDMEIVEITWVCASENYLTLMARPLGIESDDLKGSVCG